MRDLKRQNTRKMALEHFQRFMGLPVTGEWHHYIVGQWGGIDRHRRVTMGWSIRETPVLCRSIMIDINPLVIS